MKISLSGIRWKEMLIIILAASLVFALLKPAEGGSRRGGGAVSFAGAAAGFLTRGQARELLYSAALPYNSKVKRENLLPNAGADSEPLTRAEAFVMVSRAFGALPKPKNDFARAAGECPVFSGVPDWAASDVSKLSKAMVITAMGGGTLHGDAIMPAGELELVVRRVFALFGTNANDDFYTAVNKKWLDSSKIPLGAASNSAIGELASRVDAQLEALLREVSKKSWEEGSLRRKISDFYKSASDSAAIEAAGWSPLAPYLSALASAPDIAGLGEIQAGISGALAADLLFGFSLQPGEDGVYAVAFNVAPALAADVAAVDKHLFTEAAGRYAKKLFLLAGFENPPESSKAALRALGPFYDALETAGPAYSQLAPERLWQMFPQAGLDALLQACQFRPGPAYLAPPEDRLGAASDFYIVEENLPDLKAFAAFLLLKQFAGSLSQDFRDAEYAYHQEIYGAAKKPSNKERALNAVKSYMPGALGELYAGKHLPGESKQGIEELFAKLAETYKGRVGGLSWMSDPMKRAAASKLGAMTIKIGSPEGAAQALESAGIDGAGGGESFFRNIVSCGVAKKNENAKKQDMAVDGGELRVSGFSTEICYDPIKNEIFCPAGVLQPPFYDPGAKTEANLGGAGWAIAREMTRAFDESGYNANGEGWWAEEDKWRFNMLKAALLANYANCEAAPGVPANIEAAMAGCVADLGGLACALQTAVSLPHTDYELFFASAAKCQAYTATRASLLAALGRPAEAGGEMPGRLRVNMTFQMFQSFYDAFGVGEGDGMYLPPEQRVALW